MRSLLVITFAVLAILAASCGGQPETWEHKCVSFRSPEFKGKSFAESTEEVGNKLGAEGWRLTTGNHMAAYACFTRPGE